MIKTKSRSIYSKIAFEIASKIASGEIGENSHFTKRSLTGLQYEVSHETVRRALGLLSLLGILETQSNVGYIVKSQKKAAEYIEQYQSCLDIQNLKQTLKGLVDRRDLLNVEIAEITKQLLVMTESFQNSNRFGNYEFEIQEGAEIVGMSISGCNFRQKTGATIAAIRRGPDFIISPPPETVFEAGDIIVAVCDYRDIELIKDLTKANPNDV